jgi:MFS family permease
LRLPRGLAPLGHRNFALYWAGFAASNTGRWIELTGSVWLVFELTHSPALLGLLGIARSIPAFVLSPIAGVIADRVDQRRLLTVTQGLALVVSLAVGLLIAAGLIEVWHIYVAVALQTAITAFDTTARQTLFPRLVPRAQLTEAVTLTVTAGRLSKLVGPVVGGVAIASLGASSPFLLNAATYLALMAAVAWMRGVDRAEAQARTSFRSELTEGLRYILGAPVLSGLLKMEVIFGVLTMNPVMITIVARDSLGVGAVGLGGLLAAPALGSFVAIAWLLTAGQRSRQGRFSILCTFAYAGALVVFAVSRDYATSAIALALLGLLDLLITVTRNSIMQLAAPPHMRGRVMANMGTITRGIGPLSETQSGVLADAVGAPLAVIGSAVALAAAAAVTVSANPTLWRFSLPPTSGSDEATPVGSSVVIDLESSISADPTDPIQ